MSRRRVIQRERGPQPAPPPAMPGAVASPRAPAGHCPKCGAHVGRAIRAHSKTCQGKAEDDVP